MSLQDKLLADLQDAMRSQDEVRRSVLRLVRSDIKNAEIAKGAALDDQGVAEVLGKRARMHRESIAEFQKGNRPDLVAREEQQLKILLGYLPQPMTRDEIVASARKVMEEVKARGPSDKGKVMSRLMPQVKSKADGKEVSDVVSELLAAL